MAPGLKLTAEAWSTLTKAADLTNVNCGTGGLDGAKTK